jgi:hypothetical protein
VQCSRAIADDGKSTGPSRRGQIPARRALVPLVGAALLALTSVSAYAANPQPQRDVLILGSTVTPDAVTGISLEEAASRSLGLSVDVADDVTWSSKTAADFSAYKAIVLGDPTCSSFDATPVSAATANTSIWGPAVTGNVIVVGADPSLHASLDGNAAALQLITNAISFASSRSDKTGAYVSLSCYYNFAEANTPVPLLNAFGPNQFSVTGDINAQCFNQAHVVAQHPALAGLTDASLSNWNCSAHEAFDHFSAGFLVLAVVLDDTHSLLIASDPTSGSPFILGRGFEPTATPELDSLVLFGSGLLASCGYVRLRWRGRRHREPVGSRVAS